MKKNNISALVLAYNRPDNLTNTLDRLLESRLSPKVYVSVDGPKTEQDKINNQEIINILKSAKYSDLIVDTQIAKKNYGVQVGVSRGIDWFFSKVDEGLIIEDDLEFGDSFIEFCSVLLDKYRDDKRIMMISGNNHFPEVQSQYSYFFSKHALIWGWATWRDRWDNYHRVIDNKMTIMNDEYIQQDLRQLASPYRISNALKALSGEIDTWDYIWNLALYLNNGLSVIPVRNLVVNVGFGDSASHTRFKSFHGYNKIHPMGDLVHPNYVYQNSRFDQKFLTFEKPYMLLIRTLVARYL